MPRVRAQLHQRAARRPGHRAPVVHAVRGLAAARRGAGTPAPIAATDRDELLDAYLQSARYAYAYLFHSPRPPAERAFEDRQTQVRDYYNYAVQQSVTRLFSHYRDAPKADAARSGESARIGDWNIHFLMDEVRLPGGKTTPYELIPASTLTFSGLRSMPARRLRRRAGRRHGAQRQ